MASKTDLANKALSNIGIGKQISDLDNDQTPEARACREFFDDCLKKVLRQFPHPFSTKFANLNLIDEDPTSEWRFSYAYPPDCLKLKRILSGQRTDTHQSRVPYRRSVIDDDQVILTDAIEPQIEYTFFNENIDNYPSDFVLAFSLLLAHYIAPRIIAGDPYKLMERCYVRYTVEIQNAQAEAFNEEQVDQEPESEFIRGRE